MRRNSDNLVIIGRDGDLVKGKIIASAIPPPKLRRLAEAAGIKPNTLSDYLKGRLSNADTQMTIWRAFCRLSGQQVEMVDFWGRLFSREVA